MRSLEALVPPPVVAVVVAAAMWGIASVTPLLQVPTAVRLAACVTFAVVGLAFSVAGMVAFRRERTTTNPMRPEAASSLVSSGIYRVTRNPMYVGVLLDLIAWAVFLSSAWALLGPLAFVLYVGRFDPRKGCCGMREFFWAR